MKRIAIAGAFFFALISLALVTNATKVPGIQKWLRSAQIYRSGIIDAEGATIAQLGAMVKFDAAVRAGGFDNATSALRAFTIDLTEIPDITNEQAGAIEILLATLPNYTADTNATLIDVIKRTSRNGDIAVAKAFNIKAALDQGKHR